MGTPALSRIASVVVAIQLPIAVVAVFVHDDDGDRGGADVVASGFLAEAADRTGAVDHVRFEMSADFDAPGLDMEPVVIGTGEVAGEASHFLMDPTALNEAMGVPSMGDSTMEMFQDPSGTYIRAPLFGAVAAEGGLVPPDFQPLVDLGDRWGRVDPTAASASGLAGEIGSGSLNMESALVVVRAAGGDDGPAGTDEVHGVAVDVYEATITFGDLVATDGYDDDLIEDMLGGIDDVPDGVDVDALIDAMLDAELGLEVGVDADGFVRLVRTVIDERFFESIMAAVDDETAEELGDTPDIEMVSTLELFDVGDPGITVVLPVIENPVDLTPWALSLVGGQLD